MDKDSIIINNKNFSLEIKNNKLILFIRDSESFIFENVLDSACEKCKNPQDKLYNVIQKQNDKYFINKPLQICADIESNKCDEKSKQNDKESKRKIIYIQDELSFENCVFSGEVHFKYIVFALQDCKKPTQPLRLDFQHCEFHKRVYFTNCEFNGNVFFNHAVFEKYADFHESIFNGVVSFYNAEFKSAPNFSTCVFQNLQATNFINVKIDDIDFDKVNDFITEYKNDKMYEKELDLLREKYRAKTKKIKLLKTQCKQETNRYRENKQKLHSKKFQAFKQEKIKKYEIRYASNARDSFRTIKNVLIANNNLLDACAWHKLELYAKEHEIDLKAPNRFSKEWIEGIQLCFYRHTSAHHTDLLKILSWFAILVGGFVALSFITNCLMDLAKWASIFWIIAVYVMFLRVNLFNALALLNCIPCFLLLPCNPKYIFGVANLFGNNKCQNDWFLNLILSLYSIAFILVIFSLQKTARKNSIIPN